MNEKVIDYQSIKKNLKAFSSKKLCVMVKANAYGLGMKEICEFLKNKVDFFGVASYDEAVKVRELINTPILIATTQRDIQKCKEHGFHFIVDNFLDLELSKQCEALNLVHIKLNTGMNRYGFDCEDKHVIKKLKLALKNQKIAGICTHFYNLSDKKTTKKQYLKFRKIKKFLNVDCITHFGGSGVINYDFDYDMIRVGIGIYQNPNQVLRIYSHIEKINTYSRGELGYEGKFKITKDTKIAILPIGYADGLLRSFSGLSVKINGKDCKIVGQICMDCCFVDVTKINCKVGDKVSVLPDLKKASLHTKLTEYEILTGFSKIR